MHRHLLLASLLAPLLACTGPTGPTGPVGPTGPKGTTGTNGTDGADASCAGVAAPAITGVSLSPGPYYAGRGYTVTVTATGGGTLSYVHVGDGADFSGAGAAQTLTPAVTGASFNFAVIVSNGCGLDMAAYGLDAVTAAKAIWVSTATHDGALGATAAAAIAAADQACAADAGKPAGAASVKALLASSLRSPGTDWVLAPSTEYVRPDGTVIGTTTAGAVFDLAVSSLVNPVSASPAAIFTGLTPGWTAGNTCTDWTLATGTGDAGQAEQVDATAFSAAAADCATPIRLLCVEQ